MADQVDEFVARLREARGIEVGVDRPVDPSGESFIDVTGPGLEMQVNYRSAVGFGFFTSSNGFGQRPDIIITEPDVAAQRVLESFLASAPRR